MLLSLLFFFFQLCILLCCLKLQSLFLKIVLLHTFGDLLHLLLLSSEHLFHLFLIFFVSLLLSFKSSRSRSGSLFVLAICNSKLIVHGILYDYKVVRCMMLEIYTLSSKRWRQILRGYTLESSNRSTGKLFFCSSVSETSPFVFNPSRLYVLFLGCNKNETPTCMKCLKYYWLIVLSYRLCQRNLREERFNTRLRQFVINKASHNAILGSSAVLIGCLKGNKYVIGVMFFHLPLDILLKLGNSLSFFLIYLLLLFDSISNCRLVFLALKEFFFDNSAASGCFRLRLFIYGIHYSIFTDS